MSKIRYEFSEDELTLTEKVLGSLEKRLQRDIKAQPGADLFIVHPTIMTDTQTLLKEVSNKITKVITTEIVATLLKREIEQCIKVHSKEGLQAMYDATDKEMKLLHSKITDGLK
jgi:hypothetical protein